MSKRELNRAELMVRIQERRLTQRQVAPDYTCPGDDVCCDDTVDTDSGADR